MEMKKGHIIRVGHSRAVVIPLELMKDLKWREKQIVIVKRVPRGILIINAMTKRKKRKDNK